MNETTDPNSQILLVAIIAFYWAMLSTWGQLLPGFWPAPRLPMKLSYGPTRTATSKR